MSAMADVPVAVSKNTVKDSKCKIVRPKCRILWVVTHMYAVIGINVRYARAALVGYK